jgi:[citrate (pro-3S)-lyase] ligase
LGKRVYKPKVFTYGSIFAGVVFEDYRKAEIKEDETVIIFCPDPNPFYKKRFSKFTNSVITLPDLLKDMLYYAVKLRPLANFIKIHPDITFIQSSNLPFPKERTESDEFVAQNKLSRHKFIKGLKEGDFLCAEKTYTEYSLTAKEVYKLSNPPKSYLNDKRIRVYNDVTENHLNIVGGYRVVPNQPREYERTIWVIGGCNQFGVSNPDDTTQAAWLQKLINEASLAIRVENRGSYAATRRNDTLYILNSLPLQKGDIVICGNLMTPYADKAKHKYKNYHMLTLRNVGNSYGDTFIDWNTHLTPNGHKAIAEQWLLFLQNNILENNCVNDKQIADTTDISDIVWSPMPLFGIPLWANALYGNAAETVSDLANELREYKKELKRSRISVGAIVMNCNPFTMGHKYLIEYAAAKVEHMYIFVVEEDKSIFSFADRLELVEKGTADLGNVTVLPSGKFIISSLTFSDYFNKSELQNREIDPSQDVELFVEHIAPTLGITVRFAGEEPLDNVTRQYNETMHRILPRYGVEFCEIPRRKQGGEVISASRVRKLLEAKDFDAIAKLVPSTTLAYLKEKYSE